MGQVEPAGVAHAPVNDGDFAVVAVVVDVGEDGPEAVGNRAGNALGAQLAIVIVRQGGDAAEIVVHKAYLHACGRTSWTAFHIFPSWMMKYSMKMKRSAARKSSSNEGRNASPEGK